MTRENPAPKLRASAVLVAAGDGTRMQLPKGLRKPFLELCGRSVLAHTCAAFDAAASVDEIVLVVHPDDLESVRGLADSQEEFAKVTQVIVGGADRTASVRAGVGATNSSSTLVAIHDAARLLITPATIESALATAAIAGAALVAVPVTDTIKESDDGERAHRTKDRSTLWAAQTPQVFRRELILELLERAESEGFKPTDDAALHEHYLGPIPLVRGESTNLKLTNPTDLAIARAILESRRSK